MQGSIVVLILKLLTVRFVLDPFPEIISLTLYSKSFVPCLGQYSPEKCHPPQEKRAPCYTFKTRTKYSFQDPTPSPNSYSLPPLIGPKVVSAQSAPAYSLSARSAIGGFSEDLQKVGKLKTESWDEAISNRCTQSKQVLKLTSQ